MEIINTTEYYTIIRRVIKPTWNQAQNISGWFYTHQNNDRCRFWHPKMSIWFVTDKGIEIPNQKCCIYRTTTTRNDKGLQTFRTLITEQSTHYILTSWDTDDSDDGLNIWAAYMNTFKQIRPTKWVATIPMSIYKQSSTKIRTLA